MRKAIVATGMLVALSVIGLTENAEAASRRDSCKAMATTGAKALRQKAKIVDANVAIANAASKRQVATATEKAADIADFDSALEKVMPKFTAAQAACLAQSGTSSPPKECVGLALQLGWAFQNLDRQAQLLGEIVPLIGQPGTQPDIDQRSAELGTLRHDVKKSLRNSSAIGKCADRL